MAPATKWMWKKSAAPPLLLLYVRRLPWLLWPPPLLWLPPWLLPLLRLVCPVGPAFIAICLIPLAGMAVALGVSPVVFAVIVGVNASTTFLMGVDGNNMLSYRHGYWNMVDFFKAGVIPTLAMVALHATVLVPLVTLAGY